MDRWRSVDQSGNREPGDAGQRGGGGVADRVELVTADLRELPFQDGEFNVVLSGLAIHNIRGDDERAEAIGEADRVCKAKGRILIVDISHSADYADLLRGRGYAVEHRPVGWRMWFGGPWVSASVVRATKP